MVKRVLLVILLIGVLSLTACEKAAPTPTPLVIPESEMSTLVALATRMANTPGAVEPTETPQPVVEVQPTATENIPSAINITGIADDSAGKALVSWDATGDFPFGFKVVWTDVQGLPVFPGDSYVYSSDPNARSAELTGETGKLYYVRVCRFTGDTCDVYSNLGIFYFKENEATPEVSTTPNKTATLAQGSKTPKPTYIAGTPTAAIKILLMKGGENGKAYIQWSSRTNPSSGFKIVYSSSNKTPVYGTDPYFYVPGGAVREAWVDGTQGTTYYYRVCGWNGSKCESYSETYTYKFPGTAATATQDASTLTITTVTASAPGAVQVNWSASGSFPNGYKVVFSQTNPNPTMSDGYVYISNEGTHTAIVDSLEPGKQYYFRVCKYYGGNCTVYSPTVTFTLAAAAVESGFTLTQVNDVAGTVEIAWTISPDSAKGYKVLMSASEPVPNSAYLAYVTSGGARNYVDTVTGAGQVYYKMCRWSGSYCLSFSNTLGVLIQP